MWINYRVAPFSAIFMVATASAQPDTYNTDVVYQRCLMEELAIASPETTVADIKALCEPSRTLTDHADANADADTEEITPFEKRMAVETQTRDELFVITPHHPNYLLPASYDFNGNNLPHNSNKVKLDNTEVQFQISLKAPFVEGLFHENGDIYVAYTNRSWWQAYNKNISSPFRETNHEPEIFYNLTTDYNLLGVKVRNLQLGLSHQSNGRSNELSRSWNRVYASVLLERHNFYVNIRPWLRLKEDKKKHPGDANGDDNPDISRYMGDGELTIFYKFHNEHSLNMMLRNNLRSDNRGAVQIGWTFPLTNRLRGYVQYFNGYGDSLIDYNESSNRLSLGFMLTDWL